MLFFVVIIEKARTAARTGERDKTMGNAQTRRMAMGGGGGHGGNGRGGGDETMGGMGGSQAEAIPNPPNLSYW